MLGPIASRIRHAPRPACPLRARSAAARQAAPLEGRSRGALDEEVRGPHRVGLQVQPAAPRRVSAAGDPGGVCGSSGASGGNGSKGERQWFQGRGRRVECEVDGRELKGVALLVRNLPRRGEGVGT